MQVHRAFHLETHNPDWSKQFQQKAELLRPIFGNNLVRIDHIGSTSIPGISAKPQIDIMVEVNSLAFVKDVYGQMKAAGFTPQGDYGGLIPGEEYFTEDASTGERISSVHVRQSGDPRLANQLNFRDYLRAHPEEMRRYEAAKQALFGEYKDDYPAYNAGKHLLIEEIEAKSNDWAV